MGIYIKGMEMPRTGQTIEIAESDTGKRYARRIESFDDWCEIIKVPQHGRLIDADLLYDAMLLRNGNRFAKMFKSDWLDIMPTILEADREEL